MPKDRFFLDAPLQQNKSVAVKDEEFHHLINVMRAKIEDKIEIVNGRGELGIASLQSIEKKQAMLFIENIVKKEPEAFKIILAQAATRPNRLDFILEKATELRVSEIWLFPGVHSEKKEFNVNNQERMRAITISAMKQCGRLYLPKIVIKPPLEAWSQESLPYPAFFGDVEPLAPLFLETYIKSKEKKGIIFFIGPESGFSASEVEILRQEGVEGVKLSENILRTDTAALVALALIQHTTLN